MHISIVVLLHKLCGSLYTVLLAICLRDLLLSAHESLVLIFLNSCIAFQSMDKMNILKYFLLKR